MQKYIGVLLVVLVIFLTAGISFAGETVNTTIILKNDWVVPDGDDKPSFRYEGLEVYWFTKRFWTGLEINHLPETDYFVIYPKFNLILGNFNLIAEAATESTGGDYLSGGLSYSRTIGNLWFYSSAKYSFGLNPKASGYLDLFFTTSYPLPKSFFVGLDAYYDYWADDQADVLVIRPFVGYKITDNLSLLVAPYRTFLKENNDWACRLKLIFCF